MNSDKRSKIAEDLKPNKISIETKKSLLIRVISGVVLTAIVLPCVFLGDWFFVTLIALASIFAGYEIVHCAKKKYNPLLYIMTILLIMCLTFWPIIRNMLKSIGTDPNLNFTFYNEFNEIYISSSVLMLGICLVFFLVTIDKNFQVRDACYMFTFGVIAGLGLQCFLFLRFYPQLEYYSNAANEMNFYFNYFDSSTLFILVVAGSLMCDCGAYFVGVFFGKNKINERISPKKTWEGAIGGTIFSAAFILAFTFILEATGHKIISNLSMERWYYVLLLAIVIPLVSQLGDFTFSSVKRYYGVKDFGFLIPGHGGVLDRIDSVLFATIASTILIIMFSANNGEWWRVFI